LAFRFAWHAVTMIGAGWKKIKIIWNIQIKLFQKKSSEVAVQQQWYDLDCFVCWNLVFISGGPGGMVPLLGTPMFTPKPYEEFFSGGAYL
jgi:hypothetical protein